MLTAASAPAGAHAPCPTQRAAVEVVHDGLTLSVEAKPGLSLLVCADPVIRDKPAEMRAHEVIRRNFATYLGKSEGPGDVFAEFPCSRINASSGRVHKEREDTICALRYALMMLRFAEAPNKTPMSRGWGGARIKRGGPEVLGKHRP